VLVRYTFSTTKNSVEISGILEPGGVLVADLPHRDAGGSRIRIDLAFPGRGERAPVYNMLGVGLHMRRIGRPEIVAKGSKPKASPLSRYAPRRVVRAVRKRAGRIKRRLT
jgi:hypothetical protein